MTQKEKEIATAIAELANECREFFEKISQTELQDSALLDEALGKLKLMHEMGIVMRYLHVNLDEIKKDIPKVVAAETVIQAKRPINTTTEGQAPAAVVVEKIFEVPDDESVMIGGGNTIVEADVVEELPYATEDEIVDAAIEETVKEATEKQIEEAAVVDDKQEIIEESQEKEASEAPSVPLVEREPIAFSSIQNPTSQAASVEEEKLPEIEASKIGAIEAEVQETAQEAVVPEELADVQPISIEDDVPAVDTNANEVISQSERKHILDALSKEFQTSAELSIHEKIGVKKSSDSLLEKLKKQPIANLKSAIAINQRFLFSNELFKGNMEAFNQAINELNHLENLDEALKFINLQLAEKYLWNYENPTVVQFVELVERRYL